MDLLVRVVIFLEILLAIIITTDRCSRRKYSITRIVIELSLFLDLKELFSIKKHAYCAIGF